MPRHSFQIDLDHPHPERTLYFPRRARGAGEEEVADYTGVQGWHRLEKNSRQSVRWRGWVGTFIAEHMGYNIDKAWHIDDWPDGYKLWLKERIKQSATNRADVYLLGYGGRARFESPMEFGFHAVWLYSDEYHDTYPCECKLDTRRPQGVINAIWLEDDAPRNRIRGGVSRSGGARGGPSGSGTRSVREIDEMRSRDRVSQSDMFDPGEKLSHWTPSKRSLLDGPPDDDDDEREPTHRLGRARARGRTRPTWPFKVMELVWIKIPEISAPDAKDTIKLWPALITNFVDTGSIAAHTYKIRLLGVDSIRKVPESIVFPYQINPLPIVKQSSRQARRTLPGSVTTAAGISRFHPLPPPAGSSPDALPRIYTNASGPYKLACTIARDISAQFCVVGQHLGDVVDPEQPRSFEWMWMGPQRIEAGDLVRLVPSRDRLEQEGVEGIEESAGTGSEPTFVQVSDLTEDGNGYVKVVGHLFEAVPGRSGPQAPTPGSLILPLPPPGNVFHRLLPEDSPGRFNIVFVAGRYEHLTTQSETHRDWIENNKLDRNHLAYWTIQMARGRELKPDVKKILSMNGLAPGGWNAITHHFVSVSGRQAGIYTAVRQARRMYLGETDDYGWSSDESDESEDESDRDSDGDSQMA